MAATRMKTNLKLQGQACGWCGEPLALGDDAAVCDGCSTPAHARCWDGANGCSRADCANAPLKQIEVKTAASTAHLRPGERLCPACRALINEADQVCHACRAIVTPDGLYHGPKQNAPGAVASLVYALVGLVVCGMIFGGVAIAKASEAKKHMANDPRLGGAGLATAGQIIGVIDIIGWVVLLLMRLGNR